ncbi:MAG: hypothetical protein RR338_00895 [Clostridia bacterium]
MLDYYKEKIDLLEEQVNLAKIGLIVKMKRKTEGIGASYTSQFEEVCERVEQATKSTNAIKALEKDLEECKQRYLEEANKPENKKAEAKKILFGGNE